MSYEQEGNTEVHHSDDCEHRDSDCNGTGSYQLHGPISKKRGRVNNRHTLVLFYVVPNYLLELLIFVFFDKC